MRCNLLARSCTSLRSASALLRASSETPNASCDRDNARLTSACPLSASLRADVRRRSRSCWATASCTVTWIRSVPPTLMRFAITSTASTVVGPVRRSADAPTGVAVSALGLCESSAAMVAALAGPNRDMASRPRAAERSEPATRHMCRSRTRRGDRWPRPRDTPPVPCRERPTPTGSTTRPSRPELCRRHRSSECSSRRGRFRHCPESTHSSRPNRGTRAAARSKSADLGILLAITYRHPSS